MWKKNSHCILLSCTDIHIYVKHLEFFIIYWKFYMIKHRSIVRVSCTKVLTNSKSVILKSIKKRRLWSHLFNKSLCLLHIRWPPLLSQTVKNVSAMQETWVQSLPGSGGSPGEANGYPLQYSWSGILENPHGQRSLAGCSPRGHKVSDMTEWLSMHSTHIYGYRELSTETV